MSQEQAEISEIGVLRTEENAHVWQGNISLKARIESGEVTESELEEAKDRINESYVPVTKGAAKRCIDGSTLMGYDDTNPADYGRQLGPQVQGGIADEAYAMRLTKGFEGADDATLLEDIEIAAAEHSQDFAPGDHTDDHNEGNPENTGCGAVNGLKIKAEMLGDDETAALTQQLADTILGLANATPAPGAFDALRAHASELLQHPDYIPSHVSEVLTKIKELNVYGVEKLVRPHNECFLTINFVPSTTFHRDHFNAATNSKIQNFNLDAWYILHEYGQDGYALVVDAVLTAINLTDGSLRVLVRQSRGETGTAEVA